MDALLPLLGILGAVAIGAMSPGPSFVFVARASVALSRADGLAAALGMGVGGIVFAGLALLGLQAILAHAGWLSAALKLVGGLYLVFLAIRLWRGAGDPVIVPETAGLRAVGLSRSFGYGLATQLSNPKAAVVYGSIFAAPLPPALPLRLAAWLPPRIFLIETGWYSIVAITFSARRPRAAYLRSKRWVDRLAGSVIGLLAMRLIVDAGRTG